MKSSRLTDQGTYRDGHTRRNLIRESNVPRYTYIFRLWFWSVLVFCDYQTLTASELQIFNDLREKSTQESHRHSSHSQKVCLQYVYTTCYNYFPFLLLSQYIDSCVFTSDMEATWSTSSNSRVKCLC